MSCWCVRMRPRCLSPHGSGLRKTHPMCSTWSLMNSTHIAELLARKWPIWCECCWIDWGWHPNLPKFSFLHRVHLLKKTHNQRITSPSSSGLRKRRSRKGSRCCQIPRSLVLPNQKSSCQKAYCWIILSITMMTNCLQKQTARHSSKLQKSIGYWTGLSSPWNRRKVLLQKMFWRLPLKWGLIQTMDFRLWVQSSRYYVKAELGKTL